MISTKKLYTRLLRGLLLVALCGAVFLIVIYGILIQDPQMLVEGQLEDLGKRTGLEFRIGAVDVSLLPLPAIAVSDVSIKGKDIDFTAAWVSLRPSFLRLICGDLVPAKIVVLRPKLMAQTNLPLSRPADALHSLPLPKSATGERKAAIPASGCQLDLESAQAEITGANDEKLFVRGLQCQMDIFADGDMEGWLQLGAMRLEHNRTTIFSLEDFRISGLVNPANFPVNTKDLHTKGRIGIAGWLKPTQFTLELNGTSAAWNGFASAEGALDINDEAIPLAISGRANKIAGGDEINFNGVQWQLDADSGRIDAVLHLPPKHTDFKLSGILQANRCSLTQWLGFARNLSPGLQLALDNIYDAHLEFKIDAKGLQVPRIEASCCGSLFTGSGSVTDFAKPVVALDLKTAKANLGLAIPESLGEWPQTPYFPYPPLTPMPGEPLLPGETGIGYDIRLAAEKLVYGPLIVQKAALRIYPGKLDVTGLEDVLLDATGKFYGGSVKGSCILGADKSLPLNITAQIRSVNGVQLSRAMPSLPFRQGSYRADINVMSRGKKLDPFLANLNGTISASGEKVSFDATGPKEIFQNMDAKVSLKSAGMLKNGIWFDARWHGNLRDADFEAKAELDGKLQFGSISSGPSFKNLPFEGRIRFEKASGALPARTEISAKGTAGGDFEKLELNNLTCSLLGIAAKGNLRLEGSKAWQGNFSTEISDLGSMLAKLDIRNVTIPPAIRRLKIAADFYGTPGNVKLSKIKGTLGQSTVNGNLGWQSRNGRPHLTFSLNADKFDMANLSAPQVGATQKNSRSSAAANRDLNLAFLRSFDASGDFRLKELVAWSLRVQNIYAPLRLESGKLNVSQATARFYGSPLQSRISADFTRGISFNSTVAVHGFDLAALAKDRKLESILTGYASLDATAKAAFTRASQMPGALNGQWDFSVINGSWQATGKNGKPEGKATRFEKIGASGKLVNGVMHSDNFKLQGSGLKVEGGGWLNLQNQELECNFNVNMKGVPDFPLRLYGTIEKNRTSIGAGKMMVNAIGGIATGFINVLGGMAEGVWKIFR